jgi:hypothetical protein
MMHHYVRFDAPGVNSRIARSVCGRIVNPKLEHAANPECEKCQQWLREFDALKFGQDDAPVAPGVGR